MLLFLMQRVKCMEKFLLSRFFPSQELNVVNQQNVYVAVFVAKAFRPVVPDGVDEFIREFLRGNVHDAACRVMFQNVMADRMHQVRFSQPDPSVQKQRVVCFGKRLGDGERCRMGEPVPGSDHERIEGVFRIQHMGECFFLGHLRHWSGLLGNDFCRLVLFDDEFHVNLFAKHFIDRRADELGIAAFQPFNSKGRRRGNDNGVVIHLDRFCCFKPGVEARLA